MTPRLAGRMAKERPSDIFSPDHHPKRQELQRRRDVERDDGEAVLERDEARAETGRQRNEYRERAPVADKRPACQQQPDKSERLGDQQHQDVEPAAVNDEVVHAAIDEDCRDRERDETEQTLAQIAENRAALETGPEARF